MARDTSRLVWLDESSHGASKSMSQIDTLTDKAKLTLFKGESTLLDLGAT